MENCSVHVLSQSGWRNPLCSRKGKVERDGKWYCKQHDPVAVRKKREARERAWKVGQQERWQKLADAQKVDKANQHKLATYDELLDICQMLERKGSVQTVLEDDELEQLRATIKKAKQ